MNREILIQFIKHPEQMTTDHLGELSEIIEKYPYFQAAHTLLAKGEKTQRSESKTVLTRAAVYSPNRIVLKKYLEKEGKAPKKQDTPIITSPAEIVTSYHEENTERPEPPTNNVIKITRLVESDESIDQLSKSLEDLITQNEIKNSSEEGIDRLILGMSQDMLELKKSRLDFMNKLNKIEEEGAINNALKKAQTKINENSDLEKPKEKKEKKSQEKESKAEKSSKKESDLDDNQSLIERFISSEPSMPTAEEMKDRIIDNFDYESFELHPDVASEYLAEIFLEQGKKERAIEIYQTLSLKFPEKKSYFAGLIKKIE